MAAQRKRQACVFISHDTRDAKLAEAFANLLDHASVGTIKSFRSSERNAHGGIPFGSEWLKTIMENLHAATDVVALLTRNSVNRPWILYEVGVAKGRFDKSALGLAMGIPLSLANTGPFAQFQNCGDDEDSLTKLMVQLIRRNPDAAPKEEAVRPLVQIFRRTVATLMPSRVDGEREDLSKTVAQLKKELELQKKEHELHEEKIQALSDAVRMAVQQLRGLAPDGRGKSRVTQRTRK